MTGNEEGIIKAVIARVCYPGKGWLSASSKSFLDSFIDPISRSRYDITHLIAVASSPQVNNEHAVPAPDARSQLSSVHEFFSK